MDRKGCAIAAFEREFRLWLDEQRLLFLGALRSDISDSTILYIMEERTLKAFLVLLDNAIISTRTNFAALQYTKDLVIDSRGRDAI